MGTYDTVVIKCTCGYSIHFQSKAGNCDLSQYNASAVPASIAESLHNCVEECTNCGKKFQLKHYQSTFVKMSKREIKCA